MNFLITGNVFGYPKGLAATEYVRLIAEGLKNNGSNVHILVPQYTDTMAFPLNTKCSGVENGVFFEYGTGSPIPPNSRLGCRIGRLRAKSLNILRLLSGRIRNRLDCVIFYGRSHSLLVQYSKWCRMLDIPLVVYVVEWTLENKEMSDEKLMDHKKFYRDILKLCDGIVVISEFLENKIIKMKSVHGSNVPCLKTTLLCDLKDWENIKPVNRLQPYILYCASLSDYWEDTVFIIEAFRRIKASNIELVLVGPTNAETQKKIHEKLDRYSLKERVVLFNDYLPKGDLYSLFSGAAALLAPLNDDARSKARFPSKIANYLLANRPLVSCNVGEVGKYLNDRESAFLSRPNSVKEFSTKIEKALFSPEKERVASNGKKFAIEKFNFVKRTKELEDFVYDISNKRK